MDGKTSRPAPTPVLCIGPNLDLGGAERHWLTLLPRLIDYGIAPRMLCVEEEGRYAGEMRRAGIPVFAVRMTRPLDLRAGLSAVPAGLRAKPDVVMTVGTIPECIGRVVSRLRGVPHVVNDHRGAGLPLRRSERAAQRLLAPGAAVTIVVTHAQVDPLVAHGYRRDRIHVISNAIDQARVTPRRSRETVRAELGLGPRTTVFLCAASLRREKRVELFCRAMARVRANGADVVGIVAGDGPEREAVVAVADPQAVRLLGQRDDLGDLLSAADVACSPSAVEAQSLFLLEAQSAGLPLVATAVGGSPEIALCGRAGLLVPPDDLGALAEALEKIAGDTELRKRLAAGAREARRRLSTIDDMAKSYAELLHSQSRNRKRHEH